MATDKPFRIVLADDEERIRRHIAGRIPLALPLFEVADTAEDGQDLLDKVEQHLPDVVFTDIRMPVLDGLEASERIHDSYPFIRTVILSGYNDFAYAQRAIQSQVFDYLLKPVRTSELTALLQRLALALNSDRDALAKLTDAGGPAPAQLCDLLKTYMKQHYAEAIGWGELAAELHYSPAHLTKVFSQMTGQTPVKYLTELRIHEAMRLLTNSHLPVAEVGRAVGYPDQYYFSRIFKQKLGVSPITYREQNGPKD